MKIYIILMLILGLIKMLKQEEYDFESEEVTVMAKFLYFVMSMISIYGVINL